MTFPGMILVFHHTPAKALSCMKNQTFEGFLAEEVHYKLFPTLLDDDIPDHFDNWLGTLDVENLMEWAELYGRSRNYGIRHLVLARFLQKS